MTIKRDPNAIQVNNSLVFVKDPDAATGDLFNDWRRFGGLGSFTLPAEAGSTTETALIDGSIAFANVAGVGNISGAVGALNAGPVHRFMEDKARSGGQVQMSIVRPATAVIQLVGFPAGNGAVVDVSDNTNRVDIPADLRSSVVGSVLEGMITAWDADAANAGAATLPSTVAPFQGATSAANDANWQGILEVQEDGEWFDTAPGYSADQEAAQANQGVLSIRNPGRSYTSITGSVNQFDRGDNQAGGGISSNFQIVPNAQLPLVTVEYRLVSAILGQYATDGTFDI